MAAEAIPNPPVFSQGLFTTFAGNMSITPQPPNIMALTAAVAVINWVFMAIVIWVRN
jgi:hypothetical protein